MPENRSMSSGRSRSISRSKSRPNSSKSRPASLSRIISARCIDDHYVYYDAPNEKPEEAEDEDVNPSYLSSRSNSQEDKDSSDQGSDEKEEYEESSESSSPTREKDVEAQKELKKSQSRRSSTKSEKDPNLVTWDGDDDPDHPKNWSMRQKWIATFVVSSFTFMSPTASTAIAPGLDAMAKDLGITNIAVQQLCLSIFVLAFGFGPMLWGPLSEVFGRVPILQLSNLMFLAFNLGAGFAQTTAQMLVCRFFAGLGGCAPQSVGGAVIRYAHPRPRRGPGRPVRPGGRCWHAENRGRAMGIYSLAPLIGPAIGPIAGAFIVENTTWRWTFWATTIFDALIQLSGAFFLRETYPPKLLQRKAAALRASTGNTALHTPHDSATAHLPSALRTAVVRPFVMLATQPIIQAIAVYMAFLFGLMYLFISTFPLVWTGVYGESVGIAGLNYLALGLGYTIGTQIAAPVNDALYRRLRARNGGEGKPEFRIPAMFVGAGLVPAGLFCYGWAAQERAPWIVADIGAAIFAAGAMVCFQCMQTYVIDSYARYAASGLAAVVVLRSMAGCGFPLFAPAMFEALGFGWGNSVLGFLAVAIGVPAVVGFWFYGERLRGMSRYAAGE